MMQEERKSILVLDTPRACIECPLSYPKDKITIEPYVYRQLYSCQCIPEDVEDIYVQDILHEKPDWCPLRDAPQKYNTDKNEYSGNMNLGYVLGFNAAIDKILKGDL